MHAQPPPPRHLPTRPPPMTGRWGDETSIGYSPSWLNRPVAGTARMDVFVKATGGAEGYEAGCVGRERGAEARAPQSCVRVDQDYTPWLARVPDCVDRFGIQEAHNARIRAFRQRKMFNAINRLQPVDVSHTVPRRQGGASCRHDGNMAVAAQAGVRLPKIHAPSAPAHNALDTHIQGSPKATPRLPKLASIHGTMTGTRPKDDVAPDPAPQRPPPPARVKHSKASPVHATRSRTRLAPLFTTTDPQ